MSWKDQFIMPNLYLETRILLGHAWCCVNVLFNFRDKKKIQSSFVQEYCKRIDRYFPFLPIVIRYVENMLSQKYKIEGTYIKASNSD